MWRSVKTITFPSKFWGVWIFLWWNNGSSDAFDVLEGKWSVTSQCSFSAEMSSGASTLGQRQICILTLGEGGFVVLVKGLSHLRGHHPLTFPSLLFMVQPLMPNWLMNRYSFLLTLLFPISFLHNLISHYYFFFFFNNTVEIDSGRAIDFPSILKNPLYPHSPHS